MFSSTDGKTILYGFTNQTMPVYKRSDDELVSGAFYIADGNGSALGVMAVVITDDVVAYFNTTEELSSLCTYDFCGTTAPPNTTVYISKGFEAGSIDALLSNIVAQGKSGDNGEFIISSVPGFDDIASIWIRVPAEYAQTGSIVCSVEANLIDVEQNNNILAYQYIETQQGPMTCPTCGGAGAIGEAQCTVCKGSKSIRDPRYTISGRCSKDIMSVYVSSIDSQSLLSYTNETVNTLSSNLFGSCESSNGEYELSFMPKGGELFIVWGVSESSNYLTIDRSSISEGYVECLSADTLITMADGSKRRIDKLHIGDFVMDKDGCPTPVYSISRGRFSPYYTIYTFEDGTTVNVVKRHRFFNADQGFYQYIDKWGVGEHAVKQNGEKVALVSEERVYKETERFGLWTKNGSYFANEILSGMAFCNKKLLENATAEQAVNMMMSIAESQLLQLIGIKGVLP